MYISTKSDSIYLKQPITFAGFVFKHPVGFGNTGRHFQDHDKFFMMPFEDKIQQGCEIIFYVTSTIIITLRNLQFLQTSVQKHTHFGN